MKKIAVIEGGYSNEKVVSIKSAKTVFDNLDHTKYHPTRVVIDENEWTAYDNDGRYPIDKNDFSFIKNSTKHSFDYAFIVIHGTPGEDGKLQGYFDMLGILGGNYAVISNPRLAGESGIDSCYRDAHRRRFAHRRYFRPLRNLAQTGRWVGDHRVPSLSLGAATATADHRNRSGA